VLRQSSSAYDEWKIQAKDLNRFQADATNFQHWFQPVARSDVCYLTQPRYTGRHFDRLCKEETKNMFHGASSGFHRVTAPLNSRLQSLRTTYS
jgi:hypothetical protein